MNILIVAHYQNDGSPTACFVHSQAKAYLQAGHQVLTISPVGIGKTDIDGKRLQGTKRCIVDGIEHVYLRYLTISRFGNRFFNHKSAILALKPRLQSILGDFCPDVIHAHGLGFNSEIGAWLKKKLCCPLVVTTHGSDTSVPFAAGRTSDLRNYANEADLLACVSSVLKKNLQVCGTTTDLRVVQNGFDVSHVVQKTNKNPLHIAQVGNLIPSKKVDVTIRAVAALAEKYKDVRLTVVGSGPERAKLEGLCRELGIAEKVVFAGQVPNQEVHQILSEATFFVMASKPEGFGIVYLEAMAAGCITVGTEDQGIADVIQNGTNGFLVPADDAPAIVRVLATCIADPDWAAQIAARGRELAMSLTWENNAQKYVTFFSELIEKQ